jgi:hypothetical protein
VVSAGSETAGPVELGIGVVVPPLELSPDSLPRATVGADYRVQFGGSGGEGRFRWELARGTLPAGISFDGASGVLNGRPTAPGEFRFEIRIISGGSTLSREYTLTIDPPPLTIGPAALPEPTFNAAYTAALQIEGGTPPYTAQITAGGLPLGLSMSSTGGFSGTPTRAGDYSFSVTVTDAVRRTAVRTFSLTVRQPLTLDTASLPDGYTSEAYTGSLGASGGKPPYSFAVSSGNLPGGVSLSSTGGLSGTPAAAGRFAFTARVTDSDSRTATHDLVIVVLDGVSLGPDSLATAVTGAAYTATFAGAGGQGPYTYTLAGGAMPDGLTLASNGQLTGTPTREGTFRFSVQVTDSRSRSVRRDYSIEVFAPLRLTVESLAEGTVGEDYRAALGATGGAPPYAFDLSAGSLPEGLSVAGAAISGRPVTAGTARFTLRVTDANRRTAPAELSIVVLDVLTLNAATLPDGMVTAAYSAALQAAGGRGPYRFTLSAGALPAGITLSEAGALAGTPTAAGPFAFTAQVTDARGRSASRAFSFTIWPQLQITTASLASGVVGTPYNQPMNGSGGRPPYRWSSLGSAPAGMSLSEAAGAWTGTPTAAGVFRFTMVLSDADNRTTQREFSIEVSLPPLPGLRITGLPATAEPQSQPAFSIASAAAYPVGLTGRVKLSFIADGGGPDDASLQFASGGRQLDFTVASGGTAAAFAVPRVALQAGTVAGQIVVTAVWVRDGAEIAPPGGAEVRLRVPAGPPVISRVELTRRSGGFDIAITGYAPTRQISRVTVRFNPAAGATLAQTEFSFPLDAAFAAYFNSPEAAAYGGQFRLTLPFNVNGDIGAILSVTVTLESLVGPSQTFTINL